MHRIAPLFLTALGAALVACAAPPAPGLEWRVLVKLVQPDSNDETVVRRAGLASGVPVQYAAAMSPQWHALRLSCADEAACAVAVQRLKADSTFFESVERDQRARPHPSSSSPS